MDHRFGGRFAIAHSRPAKGVASLRTHGRAQSVWARPLATTIVFILAAASGLLGIGVGLSCIALAGAGFFLLELKETRRQESPRRVLNSLIPLTLEEFRRVLSTNCPLEPAFGVWQLLTHDSLGLAAGDSSLSTHLEAHAALKDTGEEVVWDAYNKRQAMFHCRGDGGPPVNAQGIRDLNHHSWTWRVALPVFDVTDRNVIAVLTVEGIGDVSDPTDLAGYGVVDVGSRAVSLLRPVMSALRS